MSAYVVSLDTIDYLAEACARYRVEVYAPMDPCETDAATLAAAPVSYDGNVWPVYGVSSSRVLGRVLYAQNVRSVNYRYDESTTESDYIPRPVPCSALAPVNVFKSINCLRYQSCETPDYEKCFAAAVLDALERAVIRALPGYDEAPYGWTRNDKEAK